MLTFQLLLTGIPKKKYIGKYSLHYEGELFDDGSIIFNRKPKEKKESGFKRKYKRNRLTVFIFTSIRGFSISIS